MLDKLLSCKCLEDFTMFAVEITDDTCYRELQREISSMGILFNADDYWSLDTVLRGTKTPQSLSNAVLKLKSEDMPLRILHTLQLLENCCPAVSPSIKKLLARTTC